jgi:hypothetical protein
MLFLQFEFNFPTIERNRLLCHYNRRQRLLFRLLLSVLFWWDVVNWSTLIDGLLIQCYFWNWFLRIFGKGFEKLPNYIRKLLFFFFYLDNGFGRLGRRRGRCWLWSLLNDDFLDLIIDEDRLFRKLGYPMFAKVGCVYYHKFRILLTFQYLMNFLQLDDDLGLFTVLLFLRFLRRLCFEHG